ncbi:kinesin motor domain-domain-containing protein [Tuber borchii]|uniref:Kinesin-like protein n=1 Tax=Tuber borchii TaxID=42251 RepID=A0A2T6ZNG9_TUBBO|nr:kinesin motor domain-domain-containing protein [Tuber borchii]
MATTTTTTLPRPPRASFNASQPPTSALPALPNSLSGRASTQNLRKASLLPQTPRKVPGPLQRPSTPSLPVLTDAKNLVPRRAVSIAAFPQPPRTGSSRIASLPPTSSLGTCNLAVDDGSKPLSPSPTRSPKRGNVGLERSSSSPSIKTSKPKTISVGSLGSGFSGGASGTAYLSPPHSRSSSAQGSYSTNATTIDASAGSGDELTVRGRTDERSGEREGKGNVIVSVRVRPDANDSGGGGNSEWIIDGRDGKVGYGGKDGGIYEYDNVFGQNDNNSRVYDSCAKRLVRRVMEGYHGTVFAYGMTGTGKTFSMQGTTSSPGVIPLAITDIFSFIRETPHREFLLRVSYLEIYNERIHDLLATQPGGTGFIPLDQQMKGEEIKLREDAKRGVYATPLKEEIVQSPTQLLRVIARGDLARRTGSTQFNARSSRSHAVVQIVVESRDRIPGTTAGAGSMADNRRAGITGGVRVSTLSLIDLAGSERAAENKERRTEGAHINRSLLTLGTVIARLSSVDKEGNGKDKDGNHLPYRDSKLTRLLQPALSGGSLVSILCTIALPPSQVSGAANATHIGETMNTLKFAARARNNIVSHAKKVDESLTGGVDAGSRVLLERYRMEITELRAQLDSQKRREGDDMRDREEREEREVERHSEQLLEIQLARTALKERIEHLNRLILSSKSSGVNSTRSSLLHGNSGHMSSLSIRSSTTTTHLARPFSTGSSVSTAINGGGSSECADDDSTGEFGDGSATLAAQVRALQADVADKNRYIATLEKRLLQARRSSQSRTSIGFSPPHKVPGMFGGGELVEEARVDVLLQEKDEEIAELRARLDDKERMVSALRSAARKRDVAEVGRRSKSSFDEGSGRRRITSGSSGGTTAEAEDGTF